MFDALPPFPDAVCHGTGIHLPWSDKLARAVPLTTALTTWRSHHGFGGQPRSCMEDGGPFEPALLARLNETLAPFHDSPLALVFITACHQPSYRSPVLPHLLSALPRFETVFALRDQTANFPATALKLVECLLRQGKTCLLLQDRSKRLFPEDAATHDAGKIQFSLITPNASKGAPQ